MGSVDTPRLYRKKRCGTYFIRVILAAADSTSDPSGRKRLEVRCSLRTTDFGRARAIAAWANARLELARTMTDRRDLWNAIKGDIRTWTITEDGISANGEEDSRQAAQFLKDVPAIANALAARLAPPASARQQELSALIDAAFQRLQEAANPTGQTVAPVATTGNITPSNPMRMSEALALYKEAKTATAEHASRTVKDKGRLLDKLVTHVAATHPELGPDPWVHDISTHHLAAFLDAASTKLSTEGEATNAGAAPKTMMKKVSDLRAFFEWAREERELTSVDPTAGLGRRSKALKQAASKVERHYEPFQTDQLKHIFEPAAYLSFTRQSDYFWPPLLALHLGTRLKELVTLKLEDIERHEETGIWFLDVTPENAKNANSIRRLPVTEKLVELGFLDYVEHLRALKATRLFPHRDWSNATLQNDPSKYSSRNFADYLSSRGLTAPNLVFHSFRHTVVSALQDRGTPLADAMQITGHQAQDHAVRTGLMSAKQAQSVHITAYTHADKARLNVEYPLARLKRHLDECILVPLDYGTLRRAASIVTEHTVKARDGFKSGWAKLDVAYTGELLLRLSGKDATVTTKCS